jgi:hypothetical protein
LPPPVYSSGLSWGSIHDFPGLKGLERLTSSGMPGFIVFSTPITKQVCPIPKREISCLTSINPLSTPKSFQESKKKKQSHPHNCLGKGKTPSERGSRIGRRITIGYPFSLPTESYKPFDGLYKKLILDQSHPRRSEITQEHIPGRLTQVYGAFRRFGSRNTAFSLYGKHAWLNL